MKFANNADTDRVVGLVRPWLKPNHQLDVVSPTFSLFEFAEILTDMHRLANARLVIPAHRPKDCLVIAHEQLELLGTKAERAARNKLQAPWLARKFAAWLDAKARPVRRGSAQPRRPQDQMRHSALQSAGGGCKPGYLWQVHRCGRVAFV